MHRSFSGLFVHPETRKPLTFFGNVMDSDNIPVHVVSPDQSFPDEMLKGLEEIQGEKWMEKMWG